MCIREARLTGMCDRADFDYDAAEVKLPECEATTDLMFF
jgi:hypothetical protein